MTFEELKPLLSWRAGCISKGELTPERLAESFTVEALPACPPFERELVGFRKRRQNERVAVARRFLESR